MGIVSCYSGNVNNVYSLVIRKSKLFDSVRKRVGNRGSHGYDEGRKHNSGCLEIFRPFGNVVPASGLQEAEDG